MALLIGTSWKMNLTSTDAGHYLATLVGLVEDLHSVELFVLPPFPALWVARERLAGTGIRWGAQDVHPEDRGAHTGDVSAPMLADLGCTIVEIGHSERRRDHGETDQLVARKVRAAQRWGMIALVCVGEAARVDDEAAASHLETQLAPLADVDPALLIVAYEPMWAIGEGASSAAPEWIGTMHGAVRERLERMYGPNTVPLLYGGSVDSASAAQTLAVPLVDGLFVGRSALDPAEFARIARVGSAAALALSQPIRGEGPR